MLRRGGPLLGTAPRDQLVKYASTAFLDAVTLYLALMAEVATAARLSFESAKLTTLWEYFRDWSRVRELYEARYRDLLSHCAV